MEPVLGVGQAQRKQFTHACLRYIVGFKSVSDLMRRIGDSSLEVLGENELADIKQVTRVKVRRLC